MNIIQWIKEKIRLLRLPKEKWQCQACGYIGGFSDYFITYSIMTCPKCGKKARFDDEKTHVFVKL